ncbi:hypothetical protein [Spiroplasma monobiae]|uniref:Uncharacterized protein n=1 Tax=Spiroplasma monobiae MQ-1 TaxID=1336748 RepID=A0A2K9LUP7_SPISQ|nr:hypothetical protein [Spiroplasma monobiae]AUM62772.1 hypothetical protein SMONO_v1c05230 [Spiroplasma monobiae MQ-1]
MNNKSNKIEEKLELLNSELENFRNDVNIWAINMETTLKKVAFAVDDQDNKIIKFVEETDKRNRNDTNIAFQKFSENQNFNINKYLFNNENKQNFKFSKLENDLNLFKENPNISLIYHDDLYKEVENFIFKKFSDEKLNTKHIDDIFCEEYQIPKNKTRIINGKKIDTTLPTYIRHHFHHINEFDNKPPSKMEIKESIILLSKIKI